MFEIEVLKSKGSVTFSSLSSAKKCCKFEKWAMITFFNQKRIKNEIV